MQKIIANILYSFESIGCRKVNILLCFTFFSAGFPKLLDSVYLNLEVHRIKYIIEVYNYDDGLFEKLIEVFPFSKEILFELLDYGALVFEVFLPIIALLNRRFFFAFIVVCGGFHLFNWCFLKIPFMGEHGGYLFFIVWGYLKHYPVKWEISDKMNTLLKWGVLLILLTFYFLRISLFMKIGFVSISIVYMLCSFFILVREWRGDPKQIN